MSGLSERYDGGPTDFRCFYYVVQPIDSIPEEQARSEVCVIIQGTIPSMLTVRWPRNGVMMCSSSKWLQTW